MSHTLWVVMGTEMNEAQPLSLRGSQANWEVGGKPVPGGHCQCYGHRRQETGAEGTQVNLRSGRLELKADKHSGESENQS